MSLTVSVDQLQRTKSKFRLGPVSFEIEAGGRLAIVGPSGSGKTTLLRCLAGLEQPDSGTIRIGEQVVDGMIEAASVGDDTTAQDAGKQDSGKRVEQHLAPNQRQVGLVFQDGALWPHMTALQHLRFAAPGMTKKDALALLDRGGLADHAKKKPPALSGGEAQRLGLLRALAPAPAVLLLDEPLRSVDVHQRDSLVLLLRSLCDERNVTSILVTHDRDEALALAEQLLVLRDGQLVEHGAAIDLLANPRTAFTAAFLRGAACLPTSSQNGRVATVFGEFAPPDNSSGKLPSGDLRLVVFPGEVEAHAVDGPEARILAIMPDEVAAGGGGLRVKVACEGQILIARTSTPTTGPTTRLRLTAPPRLLPWHHPTSNPPADNES